MNNRLAKLTTSLHLKKYRSLHGLYVAEGAKVIQDLIQNEAKCEVLLATKEWMEQNPLVSERENCVEFSPKDLKKLSRLKSPPAVIGLFKIKKETPPSTEQITQSISLVLDGIQDPGNFGTIIRTAAWFNIPYIFCSPETTDLYNPKVIQSTMGAIQQVQLIYTPLVPLLENLKGNIAVFGADMEGKNIYTHTLPVQGIVVIGNEGKGISSEVQQHLSEKLSIPPFSKQPPESLNAAVSTAIICSEFRRRQLL